MRRIFKKWGEWLTGIKPPEKDGAAFLLTFGKLEIGELKREGGEWAFAYTDSFREQDEIKPIMGFSSTEREYHSAELWPFFAIRVPSLSQPMVREYMHEKNLEEIDEAVMLAEFGERSVSNPFRLVLAS